MNALYKRVSTQVALTILAVATATGTCCSKKNISPQSFNIYLGKSYGKGKSGKEAAKHFSESINGVYSDQEIQVKIYILGSQGPPEQMEEVIIPALK